MDKLILRKRNGGPEGHGEMLIQPVLPDPAGRRRQGYSNRKGFSGAH